MAERKPRLLLANGEKFVSPVKRSGGGGPKAEPRTYEEARSHVKSELTRSIEALRAVPEKKRLKNESILCLRLHPGFVAKSYDPQHIFQRVPDLSKIGSRNFDVAASEYEALKPKPGRNTISSRMVFVRSAEAGFRRLLKELDASESSLTRGFASEICRIEKFDLQTDEERLSAFEKMPGWEEGRVEFVLHPSAYPTEEQIQLMLDLFSDCESFQNNPRFAPYEEGPFFLSAHIHRDDLEKLSGLIPLRTAHPLVAGSFEDLRTAPTASAPPPPADPSRSTITVGLFDGGVDPSNPLLAGHVVHDESMSIAATEHPDGIAHGTAVAGLLLHGPLNSKDKTVPLESPRVSVASYRVLPTSDPGDVDLYEAIDVIENVVPSRSDIRVYNVSLGPRGPIFDDSISRFTYALDVLAKDYQVTFCVAVGNDGEQPPDHNRVQAPADLVNGLGVGAWTQNGGDREIAPYSCRGPGREGAKVKPDVVAFGGCENSPIHVVSTTPGQKQLTQGTSFSTPLVTSLVGEAIGKLDRGSALLARALVVHSAEHPLNRPDHDFGHGIVPDQMLDVLNCGENEVTIAYQGPIPLKSSVKLPLLLPSGTVSEGQVHFKWTVAILPEVDPLHSDDYTKHCVEASFYPNSKRYAFNPPKNLPGGKRQTLHIEDDQQVIQGLMTQGYQRSALPLTDSGNKYRTESAHRDEMKWEPIVKRVVTKRAPSVDEPFLVLDAIPRHESSGRLDYAVVVTMKATRNVDLYSEILQRYPALQPIRLRSEAELRVQV
ncbi:MAG: S8 family peptidase [Verrucomicrobiales bacterium]|nr:S8 family peptidase [Verrucomicrobiales bacterium]